MIRRQLLAVGLLAAWMLVACGCGVHQSEYDAKVAEAKVQAEKVAQLQKDLDSVKNLIDKAKESRKKDAEARTKALEQENASLKERVRVLEQENAGLKTNGEHTATQLRRDMDAVRAELAKSEQLKNAAENRLKAVEQENTELRKRAGPLDFLKKK